jgi:DNA-binding CsgD family transcriptional regulator
MEFTVHKNEGTIITQKEVDLVKMLSDGKRASEIAQVFEKSVRTVETNMSTLRAKTNCRTLPQLVALFLRSKLIE